MIVPVGWSAAKAASVENERLTSVRGVGTSVSVAR
jgi:hypothetical protein